MRARVLDAYQHGPEAVVALVATLMSDLAAQLETLSARVTALEGENATLRAKLETTSHNSSKPPSSDGPGVKPHPKSQRTRSGRQPGGQPGHAGHTVRLVDGGVRPNRRKFRHAHGPPRSPLERTLSSCSWLIPQCRKTPVALFPYDIPFRQGFPYLSPCAARTIL